MMWILFVTSVLYVNYLSKYFRKVIYNHHQTTNSEECTPDDSDDETTSTTKNWKQFLQNYDTKITELFIYLLVNFELPSSGELLTFLESYNDYAIEHVLKVCLSDNWLFLIRILIHFCFLREFYCIPKKEIKHFWYVRFLTVILFRKFRLNLHFLIWSETIGKWILWFLVFILYDSIKFPLINSFQSIIIWRDLIKIMCFKSIMTASIKWIPHT